MSKKNNYKLNEELLDNVVKNNELAIQKIREANKIIYNNISMLLEEDNKIHYAVSEDGLSVVKNFINEISFIDGINRRIEDHISHFKNKKSLP